MLEPGGALALIVHTVEGRPVPPSPGPPPIPHAEIKVLVERYLGSAGRAGQGIAPVRTHRFEDVLVRTRFGERIEDFAQEVRELLTLRSPEGIFWDWPGDTEVILAQKPDCGCLDAPV